MSSFLDALSPVDGRYANQVVSLRSYFSEFALFKYRIRVEIEYLIRLSELGLPSLPAFNASQKEQLHSIYLKFNKEEAEKIKSIEKRTNHDIKAVEYYIKEKLAEFGLAEIMEWVHFGLTSQDINNTAIPLSMKEANDGVIIPVLTTLVQSVHDLAQSWKNIPMLARTHGQPASPTSLGKEFYVFKERLEIQLKQLKTTRWAAKFGGATGNLNAHKVAFPHQNWIGFVNSFIESLGLYRSITTTQIEHYDQLAEYCFTLSRVNTILIDLCRDCWLYISMDYFKQQVNPGETGSSAMPHKVNPIDFENAEGNLGISNALLIHFAQKLPISRLQRDLTDSTVLRNLGVPLAHCLISIKSIERGLSKLRLNEKAIQLDLQKHAVVISEAIQTILRKENYPEPYEALKELTRGKESVDLKTIQDFILTLDISEKLKIELLAITPENYTGIIDY
jgi:adenylosuccinate lyase